MLSDLLQALPQLRSQIYFKASLTALSHAMEDQVLASTSDQPLLIASFQQERYYRQEAHRYQRIAQQSNQVYVLAAPETDFTNASGCYETVAFAPHDLLSQEWHLVVIGQHYATCLVCRECPVSASIEGRQASELPASFDMDSARRFEGIWTSDRYVSYKAAELLLERILVYRPELESKIEQTYRYLGLSTRLDQEVIAPSRRNARKKPKNEVRLAFNRDREWQRLDAESNHPASNRINPDPFVQRLVTYLQAGQYKLLKTYRSIAAQERKERLVNSITAAIRRGSHTGQPLHPQEILKVAVKELGQALSACRCLIYRAQARDAAATIDHEFLSPGVLSLMGQNWPLQESPLFQELRQQDEGIYVADTQTDPRVRNTPTLQEIVSRFAIRSWLMVPVLYQGRLLGIVELHHCGSTPYQWEADELALVEAIASQVGAALIQAEAYINLEDLNQQLEALDRTRSNLIAITGHELRTPLSTIQVCLESLATEPDMPPELRQVMLNTALNDSERMRKLVQDFLTLSSLESGRVEWHPEALPIEECVDLALSRIRTRSATEDLPQISTQVPSLPLVWADGDWLVEVISKLLENACKFTPAQEQITIRAACNGDSMLEVTVADTGRGIEPNRLEIVFDRFYQEEGALRRTTGGTGLGLAICRQIVNAWGGQIWAKSAGKDQGSQFHFTVPIVVSGQ